MFEGENSDVIARSLHDDEYGEHSSDAENLYVFSMFSRISRIFLPDENLN